MDERVGVVRGVFDTRSTAIAAFDLLLAHALAARFVPVPRLGRVKSVELQLPDRRLNPFSLQAGPRHVNFYLRRPILGEHPGLFSRAVKRYGPVPANRLDEYRVHIRTVADAEDVLAFLRDEAAWPAQRSDRRFTAETFFPLTAWHLLTAARRLADGLSGHGYGPSTDYDMLFEGGRLAPKAVFGIAASAALGFPVRPENFQGGEGTICFRFLRRCGYEVVAKGATTTSDPAFLSDEDRSWAEGRLRLVAHLRRERGPGLSAAKREAFRAEHGRLFCERCGMEPVAVFGSVLGEACIEVHHEATHVADMADGHRTGLDDLRCLCANCHRVTHRELREREPAEEPGSNSPVRSSF